MAWFEHAPSSQYKMDEFERRQKEKEEFDAKMREEREKEEKRLTKKIEWFDDPVKEDDDDLWIADRRWQYDKNDPLMDFVRSNTTRPKRRRKSTTASFY